MNVRTENYLLWQGHLKRHDPDSIYRIVVRPVSQEFCIDRRSGSDSLNVPQWSLVSDSYTRYMVLFEYLWSTL